jgi:ligand-binding sensor domain-containing protein
VYVDKTGILWVATKSGVNKCNLFSFPISNRINSVLTNTQINSVFEDSFGQIWLGLQNGNLAKYNKQTDKITVFENNSTQLKSLQTKGSIDDIAEDGFGNLWIASWGGGLNRLSLAQERLGNPVFSRILKGDKTGVSENNISSIEYFQGRLYIGTNNSGIDCISFASNGSIQSIENINTKSTQGGLLSNTINSIYNDTIGHCLWISTPSGLNKIIESAGKLNYTAFTSSNKVNRISHNFVWAVCRTSIENLWVGTIEDGLNKLTFDKTGKKQTKLNMIRTNCGLSSNSVQSIVFDKTNNDLWLGGNDIVRFNTKSNMSMSYNTSDGINGNYFRVGAACTSANGTLYFGSNNGLNIIKTNSIRSNPFVPQVQISSVSLFGKELEVGKEIDHTVYLTESLANTKEIEFGHDKNNISFEYLFISLLEDLNSRLKLLFEINIRALYQSTNLFA